jgi:hypothetical protein
LYQNQQANRHEKLWGACIGALGIAFTLLLGDFLLNAVAALLTVGDTTGKIKLLLAHVYWTYLAAIWLVIPSAVIGYRIGFQNTLEQLGVFWCSNTPRNPRKSTLYWFILTVVAVASSKLT